MSIGYQFPVIRTIHDILPHIDEDSFRVKEGEEGLTYINYVRMGDETFPSIPENTSDEATLTARVRRECRGIVFNSLSGRIASRPFHKFFNLGEREDVSADHRALYDEPFYITEKFDGSMIRPLPTNDGIRWGTKMGITDVGKLAEEFVAGEKKYEDLAAHCIDCDFTPIFEFCSNKCRIVVNHPEDKMVLLALRNNVTGEYLHWKQLHAFARKFDLDVVGVQFTRQDSLREYAELKRTETEGEGVVITYYNGHRVKVKHDWYVRVHRAKEMLSSERHFLSLYYNEEIDDLLAVLLPEDRDRIRTYINRFEDRVHAVMIQVQGAYNRARALYETKRDFAIASAKEDYHSAWIRGLIFALWDGKVATPSEAVHKHIQKSLTNTKRFDETKEALCLYVGWEGEPLVEE